MKVHLSEMKLCIYKMLEGKKSLFVIYVFLELFF
jgi:hypothetical protein